MDTVCIVGWGSLVGVFGEVGLEGELEEELACFFLFFFRLDGLGFVGSVVAMSESEEGCREGAIII